MICSFVFQVFMKKKVVNFDFCAILCDAQIVQTHFKRTVGVENK